MDIIELDKTGGLLERTGLTVANFPEFLKILNTKYPEIGDIRICRPLRIGYEDANFFLECDRGEFALKIFAFDMSINSARSHARVLELANKVHLPTVEIVPNKEGGYFTIILDQFCFITRWVNGTYFADLNPDLDDMIAIAKELIKLNKIDEPLAVSYDSWGNAGFLWEYKRNYEKLPTNVLKLVRPVINKLRFLDITGFRDGLIHGDIQRKHVMRREEGGYCILDFGVARKDLLVYELSMFLAWFCLNEGNWQDRESIIHKILETYEVEIPLSVAERKSIPLLIAGAYAAYYLRTEVLIANGDDSHETKEWNCKALIMLEKAQYIFSDEVCNESTNLFRS